MERPPEKERVVEYPQSHHRHSEIIEVKAQIEEMYRLVKIDKELARSEYRQAFEHLTKMGDAQHRVNEKLQVIVSYFKKLEEIIVSPKF